MPIRQIKTSITLLVTFIAIAAKAQHITIVSQSKPTSIRGLCVVNNNVAWASGSKGYVAHTTDGGHTWIWQQIKGYETADFRSIEAFSDKEAIMMSSGTPAVVFKTNDGGATWNLKYKNADSAYFFDAMSFANNKYGFILGDPIVNKFLILESKDGGETWNEYANAPIALKDQAAFAASGTCLRVLGNNTIVIATGGAAAEINILGSDGNWAKHEVAISNGQPSKGIFSVAIQGRRMVAVGGDYKHDKNADSTACYADNFGTTWQPAKTPPGGFQSCVEYINDNTLLSTGTSGSNITFNNGLTWTKINDKSFNVCRKAKHGNLILLAGNDGEIAIYQQ